MYIIYIFLTTCWNIALLLLNAKNHSYFKAYCFNIFNFVDSCWFLLKISFSNFFFFTFHWHCFIINYSFILWLITVILSHGLYVGYVIYFVLVWNVLVAIIKVVFFFFFMVFDQIFVSTFFFKLWLLLLLTEKLKK